MRRFLSLVRALAIVVLPAVLVSGCRCPACLPDANCAYQLSAPGSPMHAPGGSVLEQVTAPVGCKWAFKGDVPWITVEAGSEGEPAGNGNGSVVIRVAANIGPRRAGTATIAYHKVTIDQAGTDGAGACTFQLFPTTTTSGAAGGPGAFAVVPSAPDCGWFAEAPSPDEDWIVEDFSRGVGSGVATYRVLAGSAVPFVPLPRTGRVVVRNAAQQVAATLTITQNP